jgi:hypothetical protein
MSSFFFQVRDPRCVYVDFHCWNINMSCFHLHKYMKW